jgi:hypothetical protein
MSRLALDVQNGAGTTPGNMFPPLLVPLIISVQAGTVKPGELDIL